LDSGIESALLWYKRIYLDGIPALLRAGETALLSLLCVVAATDALAAYRYPTNKVRDRFEDFVKNYFPPVRAINCIILPEVGTLLWGIAAAIMPAVCGELRAQQTAVAAARRRPNLASRHPVAPALTSPLG
jgi:hypothetical protein